MSGSGILLKALAQIYIQHCMCKLRMLMLTFVGVVKLIVEWFAWDQIDTTRACGQINLCMTSLTNIGRTVFIFNGSLHV